MQIIVVLLLAIALALLVLGLIGASSALVVGSILASLLAIALIVRARRARVGQPAVAAVARPEARPVRRTPLLSSASGGGRHAATRLADDPVPAVDPDSAGSPALVEDGATDPEAAADEDAEEDPPPAGTTAPLAEHGQSSVWVIDGRPRYHLVECRHLDGTAEPISLNQAVEDGFTPCADCDPDNRIT
jgi:hypothetical protein